MSEKVRESWRRLKLEEVGGGRRRSEEVGEGWRRLEKVREGRESLGRESRKIEEKREKDSSFVKVNFSFSFVCFSETIVKQ